MISDESSLNFHLAIKADPNRPHILLRPDNSKNLENKNLHFVIAWKPAGFLSVPSRDNTDSRPIMGLWLQESLGKQIYPIHRLDFEVGGVMIFATSSEAHRILNSIFEKQLIHKKYSAVSIRGKNLVKEDYPYLKEDIFSAPNNTSVGSKFIWKSKLVRGKRRTFTADYGKPSETHALLTKSSEVVLKSTSEKVIVSEWELHPITGRAHQLRFEMQSHGVPVFGDTLYSSKYKGLNNGIALQCDGFSLFDDAINQAKKIDFPSSFMLPEILKQQPEYQLVLDNL